MQKSRQKKRGKSRKIEVPWDGKTELPSHTCSNLEGSRGSGTELNLHPKMMENQWKHYLKSIEKSIKKSEISRLIAINEKILIDYNQ